MRDFKPKGSSSDYGVITLLTKTLPGFALIENVLIKLGVMDYGIYL